MLQAGSAAADFQYNLQSCGKVVLAPDSLEGQKRFLQEADKDTLIIMISCSGKAFRSYSIPDSAAYVCLITNTPQEGGPFDRTVVISCEDNFASRPLSLKVFCDLVTLRYADTYGKQ